MVEVFLIARSEPNWPVWLDTAAQLLKRSLTIGLDRRNTPPAGPAAFLATLAEFYATGSDPNKTWQRPGPFLRHAHASLLCITPQQLACELPSVCDVKLVAAEIKHPTLSLFVASATLEEWRNACVNGTASEFEEVRLFFDKVVTHFEAQGMGFVFAEYRHRSRNDGTFSLIKV